MDINYIHFKHGLSFNASLDHSKWAVMNGQPYTCIGDINRAVSFKGFYHIILFYLKSGDSFERCMQCMYLIELLNYLSDSCKTNTTFTKIIIRKVETRCE